METPAVAQSEAAMEVRITSIKLSWGDALNLTWQFVISSLVIGAVIGVITGTLYLFIRSMQ